MSKQKEFNMDMERYLEKPRSDQVIIKKKKKKPDEKVEELYPELDDVTKVHVIKDEGSLKKRFRQYKKKLLEMLRKEEKELESVELPDDEEKAEEIVEEIEERIEQDVNEQVKLTQRFKNFFVNLFGMQDKVEEDEYKPSEKQTHLDEQESPEELEEEFEEEKMEEEIQESRHGIWKRFLIKIGIIEKGSEESQEDSDITIEEEKPIKKVVLYKPQMDRDMKLALMIARKYLDDLTFQAKEKFEKSGDKKHFEQALRRLKM